MNLQMFLQKMLGYIGVTMRPRIFCKNIRIFMPFCFLATLDGEISGLMKIIKFWLGLIGIGCVLSLAYAEVVDHYSFISAQQQQKFERLITELRCLVCQNQNLADSNADLAKDLRAQVYNMVLANQSEDEIKLYMTQRYGDYILFKPPFNTKTAVLWLGPFILLSFALLVLWKLTRNRE